MLKLLVRTLGRSFYQQHVGLFLVGFYLLFGAVEGSQLVSYHLAILMAICSSSMIFGLLFIIWSLYALKSLHFVHQQLKNENYGFVNQLAALPVKRQLNLWFRLYAYLLLPILIYAGLIIVISLKHGFYFTLFATISGLFVLLLTLAFQTYKSLNYRFKVAKRWIKFPAIYFKRPFWSWPLFHLLQERKLMFLVVKLVSIIFFKAILLLFEDVGPDIRVYLTAMLAVALSHAILIFNLVKFEATYLSFIVSLPVNPFKRLCNWVVVILLLLLPEYSLLCWFTGSNFLQTVQEILFCTGSMLFLLTLVYLLKADMEKYIKALLFFFFAAMLTILAHYYLLFSFTCILIATSIYLWRYYRIDWKTIA